MSGDLRLEELRAYFRQSGLARTREMHALLDHLANDDSDEAALRRLAAHFHGLAGMGATYGFPRVSELGDAGEALLQDVAAAPGEALLARCRDLVRGVERELDAS